MDIAITENGNKCTLGVSGRLDSNTAPELEGKIKDIIDNISSLSFDFSGLDYISSAGLRVLLASHKRMIASNGTMTIKNARENVKEIFAITGMGNVFNIE